MIPRPLLFAALLLTTTAAASAPPFVSPESRGDPDSAYWEWNDFGFIGATFVSAAPDVANPATNPGTAILSEATGNALVASSRNIYATFGQLDFTIDVPAPASTSPCAGLEVVVQTSIFSLSFNVTQITINGRSADQIDNLARTVFDPPFPGQPEGVESADMLTWFLDSAGPFQVSITEGDGPDDLIGFSLDRLAVDVALVSAACAADFTGDCTVDVFDILAFFAAFGAGQADLNVDGEVNIFDILRYFELFAAC